ncbi:MAG TPA: hypothetical protein EYN14_01300 [Alphaproteobacteria bacterium]|nr:hypothetical protein [Alphaproteobacteria bacterium]
MQGPFTERHVGGMAYRHADLNDGTDAAHNRLENFRILAVKDLWAYVVPGNKETINTTHHDWAFDRFYRDGIAKRPVNIRNIKTKATPKRTTHEQGEGLLAENKWTSQSDIVQANTTSANYGFVDVTDANAPTRVYLLSGSYDPITQVDDPPNAEAMWRSVQLNETFTLPLEATFKVICGDVEITSPDRIGGSTFELNSPESTNEGLHLQYSLAASGSSWITVTELDANTYEVLSEAAGGTWTPVSVSIGGSGRDRHQSVYLRWIASTSAGTGYDGWAIGDVNITEKSLAQPYGNYDRSSQVVSVHSTGGTSRFWSKLYAATGSFEVPAGGVHDDALLWESIDSDAISDTRDTPKLLAVGQTILDSDEPLLPPFSPAQFDPFVTDHIITERFSAPGGPETAGDAFGGFGLDVRTNKYSVYNALPWRNLAVRTPLQTLLTTHCDNYGALAQSTLSEDGATTAMTASYHKVHKNTDYDIRQTPGLTPFRVNSMLFADNDNNYVGSIDEELKKFTVSTWIHPTSDTLGYINVMSTAVLGEVFRLYLIGPPNSNKIGVSALFSEDGTAPGAINYWWTDPIEEDAWSNVTVVWDLDDGADPTDAPKIYVNGQGVAVSIYDTSVTSRTARPAWLWEDITDFKASHESFGFTGHIQDMSLWNKALSPRQVKDIYRLPGYDSFGPGDLNRLSYVTSDDITNSLIGWWKFGTDGVSTITDYAPINTSANLAQATPGNRAATSGAEFLPAYYHGTDCFAVHDNYYVQHPIPSNEYGYAWITASADRDVGCDLLTTASFVTSSDFGSYLIGATRVWGSTTADKGNSGFVPTDFVGLNTNIREPVTSSSNFLGFPSSVRLVRAVMSDESYLNWAFVPTSAATQLTRGGEAFHSLLLHRNGPYGYPSWKQLRTGDHPIARYHKRNNTISVSDKPTTRTLEHGNTVQQIVEMKASSHTNYIEPMISYKYKSMLHRISTLGDGEIQDLTIQHTYGNNLATFSNRPLADLVSAVDSVLPRQVYDDIKDTYLLGDESAVSNPVKAFKSLVYSETIYPKGVNTFLSGSRARLSWAETNDEIREARNGDYRTFWRNDKEDRRRDDGALNCMGYKIHEQPNQAANAAESPMMILGTGSLSIWPLDVGKGLRDDLGDLDGDLFGFPGRLAQDTLRVKHGLIPFDDEYGGVWGELQGRDPNATLFASMTTVQLNQLNFGSDNGWNASTDTPHFMSDAFYKCPATASVCFNFYQPLQYGRDEHGDTGGADFEEGYPEMVMRTDVGDDRQKGSRSLRPSDWKTHYWSKRNPWYDSYEDFNEDVRRIGQEYTIIPEFRISEHMDFYIDNSFYTETPNYKFLSLEGATQSSSADHYTSSYVEPFWKEYCHSDFMTHFGTIQSDHLDIAKPGAISLKCTVVKKLLPYNGFYPVQRSLQLAALMSSSYAPFISGSGQATHGPDIETNLAGDDLVEQPRYMAERIQSLLQPFYAPGIFYNSIKAGIAVDYPIHTSSAEIIPLTNTNNGTWGMPTAHTADGVTFPSGAYMSSCAVRNLPDMRMPFEALINPDGWLLVSASIDQTGTGAEEIDVDPVTKNRHYLTAPFYGSSSFYFTWDGTSKPHYSMAANNFAAEVPNFFLQNKTLTTFRSKPEKDFATIASEIHLASAISPMRLCSGWKPHT